MRKPTCVRVGTLVFRFVFPRFTTPSLGVAIRCYVSVPISIIVCPARHTSAPWHRQPLCFMHIVSCRRGEKKTKKTYAPYISFAKLWPLLSCVLVAWRASLPSVKTKIPDRFSVLSRRDMKCVVSWLDMPSGPVKSRHLPEEMIRSTADSKAVMGCAGVVEMREGGRGKKAIIQSSTSVHLQRPTFVMHYRTRSRDPTVPSSRLVSLRSNGAER